MEANINPSAMSWSFQVSIDLSKQKVVLGMKLSDIRWEIKKYYSPVVISVIPPLCGVQAALTFLSVKGRLPVFSRRIFSMDLKF